MFPLPKSILLPILILTSLVVTALGFAFSIKHSQGAQAHVSHKASSVDAPHILSQPLQT